MIPGSVRWLKVPQPINLIVVFVWKGFDPGPQFFGDKSFEDFSKCPFFSNFLIPCSFVNKTYDSNIGKPIQKYLYSSY